MKDINDIDLVFNDCLDAVMSGQATVADCLARHPEHAAELEGLLLTSLQISKAAIIAPPPGAKMRIRVALNERMAELSRRKAKPMPFWRSGWANAIVTFVLGLSLAGGGVAYAASGAMPGEALYPLKLDLERALVNVTFSTDAKIELYAALNDRRVDEIIYLAERGDSLAIVEVTSRLENNFAAAAALKGISAEDFSRALMAPAENPVEKTPDQTVVGGQTVPSFGPVVTVAIPPSGSALDAALREHAADQLNALANAPAGGSPAVQAALDRAIAAVRNGYDVLLSPNE